jgi:hypothetical protein
MNVSGAKQMANASARTTEIKDDANLGLAILIAEDEEGNYEPIGAVVSINEAREIAQSNLRAKRRGLERTRIPASARSPIRSGRRDPMAATAR